MGCNKVNEPVPYIVHESAMARLERTIKRLWVLCLVLFLSFVISNGVWIYYENSFEDVTVTEATQDGNGVNIIGQGINYGAESSGN